MTLSDEAKKAFERYHGVSTEMISKTGYSPRVSPKKYSSTEPISNADKKDLANLLILSTW
jgi:hypothetical protein